MRRFLCRMGMVSALAFSAAMPLSAAGPVEDCYDRVIDRCAAAMEEAAWYEDVAIGIMCSGMLAGCTTVAF